VWSGKTYEAAAQVEKAEERKMHALARNNKNHKTRRNGNTPERSLRKLRESPASERKFQAQHDQRTVSPILLPACGGPHGKIAGGDSL